MARNELCSCGSGKRYKHCCGAIAAPAQASALASRLQQALALHQRGDIDAAVDIYRETLAVEPNQPIALHFLGVAHYQRGHFQQAVELIERSLRFVRNEADFFNNLGLALSECARWVEAISAYRQALALAPDRVAVHNNLGLALQAQNEVYTAIAHFRRAIGIDPDYAEAHWNLSLALLLVGEYEEGWHEYEWRLSIAELGGASALPLKRWDRKTSASVVLIDAEQGLGDTLQFARYLPLFTARGSSAVFRCQPELVRLFSGQYSGVSIHSTDDALPLCDAYLPLLSLPLTCETTVETIPASIPYIRPPEQLVARWRDRLAPYQGQLKVGLVWGGRRTLHTDRARSCTLGDLAPLAQVKGVQLFSLQKGDDASQLSAAPTSLDIVDWTAELGDFADTAALVSALDLLITVDTSVAHLAGAMGKSVWIMLPFAPAWRWFLQRENSPWYPTARLFRQREPARWEPVVNDICSALQALGR